MKKIVLLDTSYPINTRNAKILLSLPEFEKYVITWNRDCRPLNENQNWKEYHYSSIAPYGNPYLKMIKLINFSIYIKKMIMKIQPDFIIASHWPMLIVGALIKKKNTKLIYENLDIPTSNTTVILHLLKKIEKIVLKKTDYIFLASRFYEGLYWFFKKPIYVIENKPFRSVLLGEVKNFSYTSERLKISFIGTVRYFECLKNLLIASKNLPVDILFFGDGPDYDKLVTFSKNQINIKFFGRYDYKDIQNIYKISDVIWAVYPNKDNNVKYAVSNKFFESLVFEKPAFYAMNTLLGSFVEQNNIGFTVDPYDIDNIRDWIVKLIRFNKVLYECIDNIKRFNSFNSLFWDEYIPVLQKVFNN